MGEEVLLNALIVIVPLIGGLGLLFVCARTIFTNPNISNTSVAVLGVGGLLCVAPTILNLVIKLPGGGEVSVIRQQLKDQNQQIKGDLGEQGAQMKGQIDELKKRFDTIQKGASPALSQVASPQYVSNMGKIVLVYFADERRVLAGKVEAFLL